MTRHGPNHDCAAAHVPPPPADVVPVIVSYVPTLVVGYHSSAPNRRTAHRRRNETGWRTCRRDHRASSRIRQKPKSP